MFQMSFRQRVLYFFLTLESSLKILFVPRILSYAPYSPNNWFKTFLYSPWGFHFLKHCGQKIESQHIKHTFWQRKRWSDVFSVFPAIVFIFVFFGHQTHHWKLGLSHTFCSTRIKAWITGMKHSYTHSAFYHSLKYSWQTPKPSTHETHILPREEELWCSKRLSEYSYTHPALFHFFWHSGQTRKTKYKTCILTVEKALCLMFQLVCRQLFLHLFLTVEPSLKIWFVRHILFHAHQSFNNSF